MGNATARSNLKSRENACHKVGRSQHRPGGHASKARGGAHGLVQRQIEASAPWQYRLPEDGRKWLSQCKHRQRLAIYLVGFLACYPGLKKMAKDLKWSRATVARFLNDLKKLGVQIPRGYVARHGTRLRTINPAALRRESETPTLPESETQELPKTLELPQRGDTVKTTAGDTAKKLRLSVAPTNQEQNQLLPVRQGLRQEIVKHDTQSAGEAAERIFRSWGLDEALAQGLRYWIALRCFRANYSRTKEPSLVRTLPQTTTYYLIAAKNFFKQHNPFVYNALMREGYDRFWTEMALRGLWDDKDCEYTVPVGASEQRRTKSLPAEQLSGASTRGYSSAAEQRAARNKEILERVFGELPEEREESDGELVCAEPELKSEPKHNLGPAETFEAFQARLDGYAAARRDAERQREEMRQHCGRTPRGARPAVGAREELMR